METAGGWGGGGEAEERGREERTNSYLPLSFFPTFLCVFLLNFLGVFQAHHLKGSWADGYSFRIPSIDKWYPFFVHSVKIRTFSRLFQSLKILLLALLGLSISFWNGSFPNPPFVYSCTSNSEIYAPSCVYLKPEKRNPESLLVYTITEDTSSWREQAIRGRVFFLLGERNSENKYPTDVPITPFFLLHLAARLRYNRWRDSVVVF